MASEAQELVFNRLTLEGVLIDTIDYKDREFDRFYATKDTASGPGWYVFGRNPGYGDSLVKLCARPDVPYRRHPWYNGQVRRGWHTRREAKAIADRMNEAGR